MTEETKAMKRGPDHALHRRHRRKSRLMTGLETAGIISMCVLALLIGIGAGIALGIALSTESSSEPLKKGEFSWLCMEPGCTSQPIKGTEPMVLLELGKLHRANHHPDRTPDTDETTVIHREDQP